MLINWRRILSGATVFLTPESPPNVQDDDEMMLMTSEAAVEEDHDFDVEAPAAAAGGAAKRPTKRDAARALSKELRELHDRRLKKLDEMKAAAVERAKVTENMTNDGEECTDCRKNNPVSRQTLSCCMLRAQPASSSS